MRLNGRASRRGIALLLLGTVVACGDGRVHSLCAGESCLPEPPRPDAGPTDAGIGLEGCAAPCGTVCCGEGQQCHQGACVARCESGVWCGLLGQEVCCAPGQRCEENACVLPPPPPPPPPECPPGRRWDEGLGECVGPVATLDTCERPQTGFFSPEVLWEATFPGGYDQVIVAPLVIDLDGDGASDVVAPFFPEGAGIESPAVLRALSGVDGHVLWESGPEENGVMGISQLAAAVLWPGEAPTLVGLDKDRRLSAWDGATGKRRWRSHDGAGEPVLCDLGWGAPAIADLDANAHPEVLCGFTVFDAEGTLKWSRQPSSGPLGAIVAVADLDGDGLLDLTDGTTAYRYDGALLWRIPDVPGGLAAVADLVDDSGAVGRDGRPEVIVSRFGQLELRDGASGVLRVPPLLLPTWDGWACYPNPASPGVGGAPALGDTDGDGIPEMVVASGECLASIALRYDGSGLYMVWGEHAVDASSAVTGAALFDFDANGRYDVVFADETRLHLDEGTLGAPKYGAAHCSGTIYEEPVVADVDGDGSANIVLARNGIGRAGLGCDAKVRPGIVVLREKRSRWANARGIWNQHAYVATQICDGADSLCAPLGPEWGAHGMVPMDNLPPWDFTPPGSTFPYDASRANTSGPWGPRWTADAEVSQVRVKEEACPGRLVAKVRVVNHGKTPLRPGTRVSVRSWKGEGVSEAATSKPLPPGGSEVVEVELPWAAASGNSALVFVEIDSDDRTAECDEDNNRKGPLALRCPGIRSRSGYGPK